MRNTLRSFLRDGVGRKRDEGARWRLGKRGDRINAMFCTKREMAKNDIIKRYLLSCFMLRYRYIFLLVFIFFSLTTFRFNFKNCVTTAKGFHSSSLFLKHYLWV